MKRRMNQSIDLREPDAGGAAVSALTPFSSTELATAVGAVTRAVSEQFQYGDQLGRLGGEEFVLVLSGVELPAALRIAEQVENAVIVSIVCGRGDRYLSTGVFPA